MLGNPSTILMQAQNAGNSASAFVNGRTYTPDANGYISAQLADVAELLSSGFQLTWSSGTTFRNVLHGGDFTTNPWQRNVAALASAGVLTADIANTVTYFPDRWFAVGGASSAIKLSKIADATVAGFSQSCKFQRKSANADVAAINFGQVMETADSIRLATRQVTLSGWVKKGANFSALALRVRLFTGTSSDDTAANMVAGSWAGSAATIDDSTLTAALLTTAFQRFQFTATVPAGTTQIGVLFSMTPVGSAGADDSVSFMGLQLEDSPQASAFERRTQEIETGLCQRYYWAISEPANGVPVANGSVTGSNAETFVVPCPVQMRAIPTVSATAGTFKANSSTAGVVAATALAGATSTATAAVLTATGTGTAGQAALLQGGGGSGIIQASADF